MNAYTSARATALKHVFDQGFAHLPEEKSDEAVDLLAITLAGGPYALELGHVAGVHGNKKITRIPSRRKALLGIAGFRGTILPVYDLAALIGLAPTPRPRWLAVVAKAELAIAFDMFEGHLRVPKEAVVPNESAEGGRQHLSHLLRGADGIRAVINLPFALQSVSAQDPNQGGITT